MIPDSRLSPHAVWRILEKSQALETEALADADTRISIPKGERSITIGVAINRRLTPALAEQGRIPRNLFFDDVLFGIRAAARAAGINLLLTATVPVRPSGPAFSYLELCRERALEGMIFVSYPADEPGLIELVESATACVAIDTEISGPRSLSLSSDNVAGAKAAVRHLAKAGRRRIAFLGGVGPEKPSADRLLGYETALSELRIEPRPEYVRHARWRHDEAYSQTRVLLELPEPPDAIFCASDLMAIGAMTAIADGGLRIPEDVAVAGFDDGEFARLVTPSLTSVRQDIAGLGSGAVQALLEILAGQKIEPPARVFPVRLVVRESSGQKQRLKRRLSRRKTDRDGSTSIDLGQSRGGLLSATTLFRHLSGVGSPFAASPEQASEIEPAPVSKRSVIALAMSSAPHQTFRRAFVDDVCNAIKAHALEHDIDLLVFSGRPVGPEKGDRSLFEVCERHGAEAIIVACLPYDDPATRELAGSKFPCVAIDIDLLGSRFGFVMSDNIDGGRQAVRHLAEAGKKRIAFLSGYGVERVAIDRRFGYSSELDRLRLEKREQYVRSAKWDHLVAYEETRRLLDLPEPPDAIFCASDVMAIGALKAIADRGLRVPEDVAVIGYDDIEYARLLDPSLTTIRQSPLALAEAAFDAVMQMLERPEQTPPVKVLPVELIVRESTKGMSVTEKPPALSV